MSTLSVDRTQDRHYGDDQGRYWSVSQVCDVVHGAYGFSDPAAMQRGTDLHLIFALSVGHSMGWCDEPDVPTEYTGYHLAMLRWIDQVKPQPMMLERSLRHKSLPYAGTMDYVGMIGNSYGVLDLKTGQKSRRDILQVHGYKNLLDKAGSMWLLYIDEYGEFEQATVKQNPRDWCAFQNGISILNWRESR